MINIIRNDLLNGLINSEEIYEENKDLIVQNKNMIFQVTTPEIQNINSYKNISIIQIGECENILRELYKLEENDTLFIFEIYEESLFFFLN